MSDKTAHELAMEKASQNFTAYGAVKDYLRTLLSDERVINELEDEIQIFPLEFRKRNSSIVNDLLNTTDLTIKILSTLKRIAGVE